MRLLLLIITLSFQSLLYAQLPATNIFVMDLWADSTANICLSNIKYITSQNANKYNNQPNFIDNHLYVTTETDSSQTEIFAYNLQNTTFTKVTLSVESEFSPTLMPDYIHFSSVVIEADGKTQRLWQYPIDREGEPALVMDTIFNVGYHCWVSDSIVAAFIIDSPPMLRLINISTQESELVTRNIGRCLKMSPTGDLSFLYKESEHEWFIKLLNTDDLSIGTIAPAIPESEDFEWMPDGTILMASGAELFKFNPATDPNWQLIADFSDLGIRAISRLAYSNGKLAMVYEH